jgi:hypothetical protein
MRWPKIISLALFFWFGGLITTKPTLLLLDTSAQDQYSYDTLIRMSEALGFQTTYQPFYNLSLHTPLETYQAVIVMIDGLFLNNLEHPLAQETVHALTIYAQQPNKMVGLLLSADLRPTQLMLQRLLELCTKFEMFTPTSQLTLEPLVNSVLTTMLQPNAYKSFSYQTSLMGIKKDEETVKKITNLLRLNLTSTHSLPNSCHILAALTPRYEPPHVLAWIMPLGIFIKNPQTNTIFLLSKTSFFSCTDAEEDFFLNPLNPTLRHYLQKAVFQTLAEFHYCTLHNTIPLVIPYKKTIPPGVIRIQRKPLQYQSIIAGWLDHENYSDEQRKALINYIFDANLNLLWFQYLAEWYFSSEGIKKEERPTIMAGIKKIVDELITKSHKTHKPIPAFFIGFNLTSNFYQRKPLNAAQDLYGTSYDRIPAPLDENYFWQPELLEAFDTFMNDWQTVIGNQLQPAGIFIDFEMYHAPEQGGMYHNLMDFSDTAWRHYAQKNEAARVCRTVEQRVTYLKNHNLFDAYFTILQQTAHELGKQIKERVKKRLPNARIGVYAPTLSNCWFYKGIVAGLSSSEQPVIFASFNNEVQKHKAWLEKNNIFIEHLGVILLSKFQKLDDLKLIHQQLKEHDGIWFNRFNRLVQTYDSQAWWAVEATPLKASFVAQEIGQFVTKY